MNQSLVIYISKAIHSKTIMKSSSEARRATNAVFVSLQPLTVEINFVHQEW
jgi:hypothetical protein